MCLIKENHFKPKANVKALTNKELEQQKIELEKILTPLYNKVMNNISKYGYGKEKFFNKMIFLDNSFKKRRIY